MNVIIPEGISDHCACIVNLDNLMVLKAKPFKFYNMWTQGDTFMTIVQEGWRERIVGVNIFKVVTKLKNLKQALKVLHRNKFSDVETEAFFALYKAYGYSTEYLY